METVAQPQHFRARWASLLVILITLSIIACGGAAIATPAPTNTPAPPRPTATVVITPPTPTRAAPSPTADVPAAQPTPTRAAAATATPQPSPTLRPPAVTTSRDRIVVVTSNEPVALDAWDNRCSGNIDHMACQELAADPLTWIDGTTFEVVALTGIESWEQLDPHRWRFRLRPGIKFHNGEPWNAAAAKLGIDLNGDGKHGGGFSMHSFISGQAIDDLTVDIICQNSKRETAACPIFPRTGLFHKYQAPEWWKKAPEAERARTSVGLGPYRITGWESGVKVTLEAYADYKPSKAAESRAPVIKHVTQVWRQEALVRASMVATGEADWADNIGFENASRVPQAIQSGSNEIFTLVPDTIWHPELKKKKVRMALAHAIDCQAIVKALYEGRNECFGNISQPGTLGITPQNSKPYEYNPILARRLLQEAQYDPKNEIRIYSRIGRVYRDIELHESVIGYWKEIGVNAKLVAMETAQHTAVRRSGCGQFAADKAIRCQEQSPPPPFSASTHYYDTPTSNESLDFQRQGFLRMSCFDVNSRVCDPELQKKIELAAATPLGDLRRQRMEELAQIAHDEYYFVPFFHIQTVYGAAKNLEWKSRYDPRIRVNTMRFK